jgi:RimJ/RimL family protein N-acetyltransferase
MAEVKLFPAAQEISFPLPLYTSIPIGTMRGIDGDEFSVVAGLDKGLAVQLKEKSLDMSDTETQRNTSDRERFGEGSYEAWYAKNRTPFALVHTSGVLAALAWFGPKPLGRKSLRHLSDAERAKDASLDAEGWHTVTYRSYPPFRGKKLMKPFMRSAIDVYRRVFPEAKLWAGVFEENPASRALATKLGFTVDETASDLDSHSTVMVLNQ